MSDIAKRLEKAEKYLQKGKLEGALEEFQAILKEDRENNSVRERAADLCISLNKQKEAAHLLAALFDRQAEVNDQAKAIVTYKKLARVSTPRIEQSFHYAQYIEKSNKKEALELFERAAEGFAAAGKDAEALAVQKRIVGLDPSLKNLKSLGKLATGIGENKVAAEAFFQVGELEKEKGDGHEWFERAHGLDRSNPNAALAYGRSLLDRADGAGALKVLEPFAKKESAPEALRETYARALLTLKRTADAEPIIWRLYQRDPKEIHQVATLIGALIDNDQHQAALRLAEKTAEAENKAGRQRDFVSLMKVVIDTHQPGAEFLEYMVALFNSSNREHDYSDTLLKLFELYFAAGNFIKAADSLDAAAEVDPYEPGHQKRLEMLKPKIDANRYRAIANRSTASVKPLAPLGQDDLAPAPTDNEPTVLEEFMLQAEIFLQYSMRSKAVERLERIQKLFPGEEKKNEKLRSLYASAGMTSKPEAPAAKSRPASAKPAKGKTAAAAGERAEASDASVDNIARITEITRNIYRQANVKGVLFTSVNDIGRHWNTSRCVAGLCTPGKPPSAALEYCAPGVKQSDVMAIVKLIGALQALTVAQGPVAIPSVKNTPELAGVKQFVEALNVESILAVPLVDGEEHVGILILEQCAEQRRWRQTDVLVLKTIADQIVLAVNNAKLRNLMKTLAVTDEKSGLLKRASYIDVLLSEVRRGLQQSSQSSVMLLHFGKASALVKEIGEPAVESMMQQVGQICCSHIRQNDVAVRYELTSIALVLADTNDKNAFFVVEKLRKALASVKVPLTERAVTCSVGIAEAVMQARFDPIDIVTEVINRAEHALETARAEGGNKAISLPPVLEAAAVA